MGPIRFTPYWSKKSVALSGNRLDVAWIRATVAENGSQAVHQNVEAVFEFQFAVWPQLALDLIASNQLTRTPCQESEQIERLSGELHRLPAAAKLPRIVVKLELAEDSYHELIPSVVDGSSVPAAGAARWVRTHERRAGRQR